MVERRRFSRIKTNEKALLQREEGQKETLLLDVSLGGMRLVLDTQINVGSTVQGEFKIIPEGGPFYVKGEVVWIKPAGDKAKHTGFEVGIKFTKVSTIPI